MIKAVLFDLDDTLYLESEFFRSGFAAVAVKLASLGVGPATMISRLLESIHFTEGRDRVLNKAASRLSFPEDWVPELVDIFRSHWPAITLAPEVETVLNRLRCKYKLGLVTDGFSEVQRRKIQALGLAAHLDSIVVADDLGRTHWKPSKVPFLDCCERLGSTPDDTVFVGDNPARDIRGAHNSGMLAIRIRTRGSYLYDLTPANEDVADFEITNLNELERLCSELSARRGRSGVLVRN